MVLLDSLVEQEALRRLPVSEHARSLLDFTQKLGEVKKTG